MRALGKRLRISLARARSTSATATRRRFRLAVREPMSDPAMPLAPKLTCDNVSLGAAPTWCRKTNGTANPVAARRFRASRRFRSGVLIGVVLWVGGLRRAPFDPTAGVGRSQAVSTLELEFRL